MGTVLILNGSPRAPKSNSKRYSQLFAAACKWETAYLELIQTEYAQLVQAMEGAQRLLLVFPLYVDGLPVALLDFFTYLETHPPKHRPPISVLINCGFLEWRQNDLAVDMIRLFAQTNGYPMGAVLKIGGGEAILDTPFRPLVGGKIRALAKAVVRDQRRTLAVTMPLTKGLFIKASARYWTRYGMKYGVTPEQMGTPDIEAQDRES